MLRRLDGIELVRLKREQGDQNLCFSSRPFVLCGLPIRRLPVDQLLYERRNGHFVLQITGHPDSGVPFGQDRVAGEFALTPRLVSGKAHDSVPANDMISGPHLWIRAFRLGFLPSAQREFDACCNNL
jgi:hypothetical protein